MAAEHAVTIVPVDSLRPHPQNYQKHPPDQLDHIARSLELHGQYRNVVVARDGTLLAGHGVIEAVKRLGWETVQVIRLDLDPEDPAAIQVLVGDNEIGNLAEVDDRLLTELLRDVAADDWDRLLGTGFDQETLAALAMVTRPRSELRDMSEAGEWLGLPGFEAEPAEPQVTVKFLTVEDQQRFLAEHLPGIGVAKRVNDAVTVYWPERPRNDLSSIRFEPEPAAP